MAEPVQTDREQRRLIRMAETISKALPYMRRHNDATFVVKYGGHAMTDPNRELPPARVGSARRGELVRLPCAL